MKTVVFLVMCALLFSCVRHPVAPEPVPTQPPVLQELALLAEMHARFLTFRDEDIFLRYGFTYNSPYADWLQRVRNLEQDPVMAEAARLLAGLAVAARIHGVQSGVYRQFEMRFDQALRGPVEQESAELLPAEQESVAQAIVAGESAGPEFTELLPVEQESVAQAVVAEESAEQESAELLPVEQESVAQAIVAGELAGQEFTELLPVEHESVAQAVVAGERAEQESAELLPVEHESVEQEPVERAPVVRGALAPPAPSLASEVLVLFSGDTQGVVFPQPGAFGSVGGLARRTSTITHFRREDPGLVLLDAGDAFASGFERAEKINKTLVRAMNHLRYDAIGLGGLDLAMGEVALRELAAMAKFPLVCSNLEFQQGVTPWIKPYVILERNGRRIAVLSVLPVPSGAVVTGARFVAPEKALGTLLPKLRGMVDFVVLLTQLGGDEAAGLLGENMVDVILGDRSAVSRTSPTYVPAVPKGMGLGLVRLNMTAPGAPARVEAMPVLLGPDSDSQILKILDEIK